MRPKLLLMSVLLLLLMGAGQALSQTVSVSPSQIPQGAYVNGPGGNADDNYFFQKLTINLVVAGGAGQTITITLPADIDVADVDNDADPDNEISLSWTGTGIAGGDFTINAAGTDESIITLDHNNASATDWVLYVMFPIKSTSSASGTQDYGVAFSDGAFTGVTGPTVTYRKAGALQIHDFLANLSADDDSTTANAYLGLQYPDPSVATYDALNDYVEDLAAATTVFQGILTEDNDDTNDIMYYVWVATDSTLSHVSELEGGVSHAEDYDFPGDYTQREGAAKTDAYYTGGLPEGEYYFFVTSSITGDFPLFRSGKLTVLHYPKVNLMGWDRDGLGFDNTGGHADDLNLTLDTGNYYDIGGLVPATPNSVNNTDLYSSVDDLDNNARVYLFYSSDTALTESHVTTSGTSPDLVVSGLTGATALVDTLYENQEDIDGFVSWNWAISTSGTIVPANSYTLYAVACDGKHFDVQKAQGTDSGDDETITIKHSPNLTFDVLTEYNLGADTVPAADLVVDPSQSDVIMLSWGKSGVNGDIDIDDSAIINFYIDYDTGQDDAADYGSTSADAIELAASAAVLPIGTHLIVSGLPENPEGKSSSYHEWNLKEDFTRTGWYPNDEGAGAAAYHLYAIIDEDKTGGTRRVVCLGDDGIITVGENTITEIEFDLDVPFSRLVDPPAEGVTVNAEETYRLNFNAFDYNDDGEVGIFIVEANTSVGGAIGPATATILQLMAATAGAGPLQGLAYCLTDNDGDHTAGGIWLSENSATTYDLTFRTPGAALAYTSDMNGDGPALSDGTYWVYIGVDPNNDDFTTGGGTETVYRAPGPLTIVNTGVAAAQRNMTVTPTHLTIAQGDTITYTVQAADNAGTIDRIDAYIAIEKDYWTLVNSTTPFTAASEYSGQLIANAVIDNAATNRWILRMTVFDAASAGGPFTVDDTGLGEPVATFQLVSKGTTNTIQGETSVYYVNEPANGWVSKFSNDGGDITINTLASNVKVVPRAIIEGIAEFQGRTSMTGIVLTLELRERDSYVSVTDSAFYNTNGGSQSTGVQYTLDNDGKFTLTKVPTGEYDLVAVYNRYLAKAVQVDVYPGVDTLFVSFGQLLGGDCVGYTDSSSAAFPDNQIETADLNRVSSAFLATSANSEWNDGTNNWKWADINEDNVVETDDLSLVTANVGNNGAQPVYKTVAQPEMSNMDALVEFTNIPKELKAGETYTIQVMTRNTSNVRAYFVDMNYDTETLTFEGIIKGDFIKADSHSFPVVGDGTVGLANSVYGNSIFSGDGLLAEVQFTARHDGIFTADLLGIRNVTLVNSDFMKEHIVAENQAGLTGDVAPVAFDLSQNFPNPFNPTTTISFTIPENENISLKIYDILGRNVRTLVEGGYAVGSYNVVWDATDMSGNTVSAGIYFYTIKAGNFVETRRMLFIK